MDKRKGQGKEQMSKKDTVTKAFMRENTVFADAFNYLIFNGKKVIQPEQLQELDTTELVQLIEKRVRSEIPGHFKGYCYYGG